LHALDFAPQQEAHRPGRLVVEQQRKIPGDQHDRFVASVMRGRNQMPPWGDLLTPDEVEALWAYVIAGETK
jgi:Cytochrome C oxidase, cbb3-type, subunit III